jgi:hypothetical protein
MAEQDLPDHGLPGQGFLEKAILRDIIMKTRHAHFCDEVVKMSMFSI